ncbi:hypothetical protein SAMN05421830_12048 [Desulfomicrobium norvegicum]|uniref:N-acetyltransferase domain-containing protein n=1 Tax=Desulfomicrobium norvegicum (strain DSM 1741 / NCIMB 8310) TaxID=52561 RepID=A0A8G2F654_DESNO|nr:hypothetical protein [Desulfomicrobium norvegicum]SFM20526.1 hypothetical protein SAMN05421830_12048 [Desulfomicrobium norvegicum]
MVQKNKIIFKDFCYLNNNILNYSILSRINQIYYFLHDIKKDYPSFDGWFYGKVVPGFFNKTRDIIIEEIDGQIAGISLVKIESERKLSTICVSDKFKNCGIGKKLFYRSFALLDTEKPFFTISQNNISKFHRIFQYYGFKKTRIIMDEHKKGLAEMYFNENY